RWNDEARRAWAVDSAELVSGEYDEAAEALVADEAEDPRTRVAELEEVLVQWYDAAQTLRRQRDEARADLARLRSQLAEAREQRDQAAEALVQAETERDEARDAQVQHATAMAAIDAEIIDDLRAVLALSPGQSLTKAVTQLRDDLAWLRRPVLAVAEDLERHASDLRFESLERR